MSECVVREINGERAARPRVVHPSAGRVNMTARSVRSLSGALKLVFSNRLTRVGAVSESTSGYLNSVKLILFYMCGGY